MALGERQFVAYAWCPACQTRYGEIAEEMFRDDGGSAHWRHVPVPATIPKACPHCDVVIEREPGGKS